jgi:hypothetical protein
MGQGVGVADFMIGRCSRLVWMRGLVYSLGPILPSPHKSVKVEENLGAHGCTSKAASSPSREPLRVNRRTPKLRDRDAAVILA